MRSTQKIRPILPWVLCLGMGASLFSTACVPYRAFTASKARWQELEEQGPKEQAKYRRSVRACTDSIDPSLEIDSKAEVAEHCTFAVVEFDDQGEFWDPGQLKDALQLVECKSFRQPKQQAAGGKPVRAQRREYSLESARCESSDLPEGAAGDEPRALVVVFVHGWKNNASPDNEANRNLGSFKKVLIRLTQAELHKAQLQGTPGRDVVGVYMSWSGRTSNAWLMNQLSFFSRKNAAQRVARVSFSHAIQRIISSTKGTRSSTRGNPESIAVVVGHSFGGLIVENTLLRTLTGETDDFSEFGADLAVLVNPANEAILARQSIQALQEAPARPLDLEGRTVSQPLIVSVTSESDSATGTLFPIGLTVKATGKRFHKYDEDEPGIRRQKFYYTHTPGHSTSRDGEDGALFSHAVDCPLSPEGCPQSPDAYDAQMARRIAEMLDSAGQDTIFPAPAVKLGPCRRPWEVENNFECIDDLWFIGAVTGDVYAVNRLPASPNQTGYWIMELPSSIVASHSDIFQSELASLLAAFINLKAAEVVGDLDEAEAYLQGLYPDD